MTLIACSPAVAEALNANRAEAERLLAAQLPDGWPDSELSEILPAYARSLHDDPLALGFGIWLLVSRDRPVVVGSAGFLGRPASDGVVELGYGVHETARGRGYATEAVRALVDWALLQDAVVRVTARCDPANAPSIRVLEKSGFTRTGVAGDLELWETDRS